MVFLITSDLKMKLSGIFPRYEHYKKESGDYEILNRFTHGNV